MIDDRRRERVLWHCRRGLLELDLLLQRFVEREFAHLTEHEHVTLQRLLDLPDTNLLDYCYGRAHPDDPELQALVGKIAR